MASRRGRSFGDWLNSSNANGRVRSADDGNGGDYGSSRHGSPSAVFAPCGRRPRTGRAPRLASSASTGAIPTPDATRSPSARPPGGASRRLAPPRVRAGPVPRATPASPRSSRVRRTASTAPTPRASATAPAFCSSQHQVRCGNAPSPARAVRSRVHVWAMPARSPPSRATMARAAAASPCSA